MRTLALSSLLAIAALVTPAHAERKDLIKRDAAPQKLAAIAASPRAEGAEASLTTGELRLTGATPAPRKEPFLSPREISAEVRPYAPEIERCYLEQLDDARRAGHLDLTFVIGRDGYVVSLTAAASGLPARAARKVESCIREAVEALHFPARRNDTTAIVPYLFQHTSAPGAGPQLSCWNPRGC